jgi:hypothetical protein
MNPIDASCYFPDAALFPEGEFSSRKKLVTAINAWAAPRGYAFSVKNSWKTSSGRIGAIYVCNRGTKPPRTSQKRLQETATRYTGCTFSVIAKEAYVRLHGV